jgi:hypothetical protein
VLWSAVAGILFAGSLPVLEAHGAAPFTLIQSSSEETGKPTAAIVLTQETLDSYTGPTYLSSRDVHTQADLVGFASALKRGDSSIKRIALGTDSISMTYRSSVHVLRFGTRAIERTVYITSTGAITVVKPWWAQFSDSRAELSDPASGFSDIAFSAEEGDSIPVETATRLLIRMHGRFQIGAL